MTPTTDLPGWARLAADWADQPVAVEHTNISVGITTAVLNLPGRRLFCKAAPGNDPAALQRLHIEATATAVHRQAAAPFHGLFRDHGWTALLFDYVDGHHPRFHPPQQGLALADRIADSIREPSRDTVASGLPSITDRVDSVPNWKTLLHDHPWLIRTAASDFLINGQDERLRRLDGDHVAHTDIHRGNILVHDQELTVVDWGWAARAAPWFDQALLGVQLVAAEASIARVTRRLHTRHIGHPCSADELTAFAVEMSRYWIGRLTANPAEQHLWHLAEAAGQLARQLGAPSFLTFVGEGDLTTGQND